MSTGGLCRGSRPTRCSMSTTNHVGLAATQPTLRSAGLLARCHAISSGNPHGPPRPLACRRWQPRRGGPVRCRAQPTACSRRLACAEVGHRAREVDEAARPLLAHRAMDRRRALHNIHPRQHLGPARPSRAFRDRELPAWFPRTARRPAFCNLRAGSDNTEVNLLRCNGGGRPGADEAMAPTARSGSVTFDTVGWLPWVLAAEAPVLRCGEVTEMDW